MKKRHSLMMILFFGLLFFNFYGYFNLSNAATSQLSNFSISGNCESGVSNSYITELSTWNGTFTQYQSSTIERNTSVNNNTMTLAAINLKAIQLRDAPYNLVVANNITNSQAAVPETAFDTPRARMAQYFTLDNFTFIGNIWLYLTGAIVGVFPTGNFQIDIYNASDFASGPINEVTHAITKGAGIFVGWDNILVNEYFEPGEYYAVFTSWLSAGLSMTNNSWQIKDYTSPADNKGPSLFENSSGWFNIPGDTTTDFLMYLEATHFCDPHELNLSASINDKPVQFYHKKDYTVKAVSFLGPLIWKPVWTSKITYYLDEPPDKDFNITISINRTIAAGSVETRGRYFYEEPTTGTFLANRSSIQWDVNYKKVNSSFTLFVFFRYPTDWMVSKFYDTSYDIELFEYGIFYSYLYGEREHALWIEEGGDGTQTFTYRATFTSPNYLTTSQAMTAREIYLGDRSTIQANIKNTEGQFVSGGNTSFYLYGADGSLIESYNKTNTNGIIESNEIDSGSLGLGTYSMVIFWTNGEEYGIIVYDITISINPLLITGIIAAIAVIATGLLLTYGRRKLAERRWEKSLHHLLVISKNGTPMYSYSFGLTLKDSALISGMLSALTSFIRETTGSKKELRRIDQEDKKIILSHGDFTTTAILASKDLPIIHDRARQFLERFEAVYSDKIQKWVGNTEIFKGANKIVEEFFPIEMEQILINKIGFELQKLKEMAETARDRTTITAILSEITNLLDKYQDLILKNYGKLVNVIINTAHQKLAAD